jgi:nicotinate phosphoribosyltransferase
MATPVANLPEGVTSLLDTDLYKLTMQCCILKFFPSVSVTYSFTNRTPDKKLNRAAFKWLQAQVNSALASYLLKIVANALQSLKIST